MISNVMEVLEGIRKDDITRLNQEDFLRLNVPNKWISSNIINCVGEALNRYTENCPNIRNGMHVSYILLRIE